MKIFHKYIAAIILLLTANTYCPAQIKPLHIGDTIPNLTITKLINYPAPSLKLSDFKGKLLILDFWFTHCGSCIETFPKNYALEQKYKGRLQFLLVDDKNSRDKVAQIQNFFSRHQLPIYDVPSVMEDTVLCAYFPHHTCPHCVWLKDNVVQAITDAEDVNDQNIARMLNHQNVPMEVKNDIRTDPSMPFFVDKNGGDSPPFIYRSILTAYDSGLEGMNGLLENDKGLVNEIQFVDYPKLSLYRMAYPEYGGFPYSRIIYNVANPPDYDLVDSMQHKSWRLRNCFVYEATFPPRSKKEALQIMRSDLDHYFHLSLDTVVREVPCWVLRLADGQKPVPVAASLKSETNLFERDGSLVYFKNKPLDDLVRALEIDLKTPVVDETHYTDNITLSLPQSRVIDENEWIASLKKQGFTLRKEKRKIKFLVLSEPNP